MKRVVQPILKPHLTQPQGAELAEKQKATQPGMAHWAKTGPEGAMCHQCASWCQLENEPAVPDRFKRKAGILKARRCNKFSRLNGGTGPAVMPESPACRYFELCIEAPRLIVKSRRRRIEHGEEGAAC